MSSDESFSQVPRTLRGHTHRAALHVGRAMRDDEGEDVQPPRAGVRGVALIFTTSQHHKVVCRDGDAVVHEVSKNVIEKI